MGIQGPHEKETEAVSDQQAFLVCGEALSLQCVKLSIEISRLRAIIATLNEFQVEGAQHIAQAVAGAEGNLKESIERLDAALLLLHSKSDKDRGNV